MEIDYPEYHYQGMGCGLEDRGVTDRYEAMQYGWDEAAGRYESEVVEPLIARIEELEDMLSRLVKENDLAMPNENYQWMYSPMRLECLKVLEGK